MTPALFLRAQARTYRLLSVSWRTVAELLRAELAELRAIRCEMAADALEAAA